MIIHARRASTAKIFPALIAAVSCLFLLSSCRPEEKYDRLTGFIAATSFIDVHAHPSSRHIDYKRIDPYPTLEPPISRPFWATDKERIAVFDTLQPPALRAVYGYGKDDVAAEDLPELKRLSEGFWEAGSGPAFNRLLDICGIERVFANSAEPREELDPARVLWVPFVDCFLSPFDASALEDVGPRLKDSISSCSREVREMAAAMNEDPKDLSSYLAFVDRALADYKTRGAVALKVAVAYHRTLWFDDPSAGSAAAAYAEGRAGKLTDWAKYKKLQDFIARRVFLKAGELGLPVHFHTGFGADAGLKNLDSSPLNLESVFSDIRFLDTNFLILHAGYPFADKLKPLLEKRNVFVEFSAVNWMVFEDELAGILHDWLRYPGASEKIMFGSDAGAPVFFWIAAENTRRALRRALIRLIDDGLITEDQAVLIAGRIMRENALRLHGLSSAR